MDLKDFIQTAVTQIAVTENVALALPIRWARICHES